MHQGTLSFNDEERTRILSILATVPTVIEMYMDRPAVIPEIAEQSHGLLANFGATDTALLDVIFGKHNPTGRLPLEMPSFMSKVDAQYEDVPYDTERPLYPFGFGLSY